MQPKTPQENQHKNQPNHLPPVIPNLQHIHGSKHLETQTLATTTTAEQKVKLVFAVSCLACYISQRQQRRYFVLTNGNSDRVLGHR